MREVTATTRIYPYHELSDNAKERARCDIAAANGFSFASESIDSIKALAAHFNGELVKYEVDFFDAMPCSPPTFDSPEIDEDEIAERLDRLGAYDPDTLKGMGDCVLTGYCADEDAIDGFRIAFHGGERDLNRLMQAAFSSWLKACQSECIAFYEDEDGCFADYADANNMEFTSTGKIWR